jgi:hypothetical protein
MYRRSDVVMLLRIKRLRYQDHHTIASAREEIRKSRKQERKNKSDVTVGANKSSIVNRKPAAESLLRSSPDLVGKPAYAGPGTANQLGLGFPTAPRAAELARRLSEMRRSVLEIIEVVKE